MRNGAIGAGGLAVNLGPLATVLLDLDVIGRHTAGGNNHIAAMGLRTGRRRTVKIVVMMLLLYAQHDGQYVPLLGAH